MTYGCFNRKPFVDTVLVQDGWSVATMPGAEGQASTRRPRMIVIPFRMKPDCQYQKDDKYNDPGCVGCKHNLKEAPPTE